MTRKENSDKAKLVSSNNSVCGNGKATVGQGLRYTAVCRLYNPADGCAYGRYKSSFTMNIDLN